MTTSVALCTYNGDKYLASQLDSILKQSVKVDEIIICDDASTDNTVLIIEEYKNKYPGFIKLNINKTKLGVIKNFEKAINLCAKDIIFLCDQDDIWNIDKVETVLNFFENNKNCEGVFHNLNLLVEDQKQDFTVWDYVCFDDEIKNLNPEDFILSTLIYGNYVTGAASAFRKRKVAFFNDIGILHDQQLSLILSKEKSLCFIDKCLGLYRIHSEQQVGVRTSKSEYRLKRKEIIDSDNFQEQIKIYSETYAGVLNIKKYFDLKKQRKLILKKNKFAKLNYLKNKNIKDRILLKLYWIYKSL